MEEDALEWQVWLVRRSASGQSLIHKKFKKIDWNLIQEIEHLIKVGKKRYLQDNVY